LQKLSLFVLAVRSLDCLLAGSGSRFTELLVAQQAASVSERRILRTLAGSFITIAILILASLGLGLGKGTVAGQYLQTFANLGSLLPSRCSPTTFIAIVISS